jgi:dihydrofolate reductase
VGRIVVTEFVSLDGVIPGGGENFRHGGWSFEVSRGDEGDEFKLDETLSSEVLLLGRVTYEGFAEDLAIQGRRGRRQVQHHAQVRRLLGPGGARVEQLDRER